MTQNIILMHPGQCREAYLKQALQWCRRRYSDLRETERCHPSFTGDDVLQEAERMFRDLGTCGVEGWCSDDGRDGVSFLNAGDTYELTIFFFASTERFRVACLDDVT